VPEECATLADSTSYPNNSCPDVTGSNSQVSPAGFAVDRQSAGSFSHSRSLTARLDIAGRSADTRDSSKSLNFASGQCCTGDVQSKPSLDVPQSISTTASDSSKISRSVECVLWLLGY